MNMMRSLSAIGALFGIGPGAVSPSAVPEPDPVRPLRPGLSIAQRRAKMRERMARETRRMIEAGPAIGTVLPDGTIWTRQRARQRSRLKAKGRA